jgi:hypothetical protein
MDTPQNWGAHEVTPHLDHFIYERGITFATTYGIKMNCYMMGVGNTLGTRENVEILFGTHWEYNGNKKRKGCHLLMWPR